MSLIIADAIKNLDEKLTETDENALSKDISKLYLKELAEKNGVSFPNLMKTLRIVLSGLEVYYLLYHLHDIL